MGSWLHTKVDVRMYDIYVYTNHTFSGSNGSLSSRIVAIGVTSDPIPAMIGMATRGTGPSNGACGPPASAAVAVAPTLPVSLSSPPGMVCSPSLPAGRCKQNRHTQVMTGDAQGGGMQTDSVMMMMMRDTTNRERIEIEMIKRRDKRCKERGRKTSAP